MNEAEHKEPINQRELRPARRLIEFLALLDELNGRNVHWYNQRLRL